MKWSIVHSLLLFLALFSLPLPTAEAQVARTIVVEHFTNTQCGRCSARNPGFYENLNKQEGVIHLAIHPSSPYPSCVLNQHNMTENDARTRYHGIFGATPRLTVQGSVISGGANYGSPDLWTPFVNQTSPVSMSIEQEKQSDRIKARVTLSTEQANSLQDLTLFLALAEDTVFYNAPNRENLHFDVFREALTDVDGDAVTLAQNVGESVTLEFETTPRVDWDLNRMFVVAILQTGADREVVQAAATSPEQNDLLSSTQNLPTLQDVRIAPNPVQNELFIGLPDQTLSTVRLFDVLGTMVLEQGFEETTQLNVGHLSFGTYFLEISNANGRFMSKLIRN